MFQKRGHIYKDPVQEILASFPTISLIKHTVSEEMLHLCRTYVQYDIWAYFANTSC